MFHRLSTTLIAAAATLSLCVSAWGQAAQQPAKNWKDRAEYDLFDGITKAQDPNKKLELLNQWKTKYPQTDFIDLRNQSYIGAYQAANKGAELFTFCKDIVTADPKEMNCLYWMNILSMEIGLPTPDQMDFGEKAAKSFLANLDSFLTIERLPKGTTQEQVDKQKTAFQAIGHSALGWAAMNRKAFDVAESELTQSLKAEPNAGRVSQWLGTVMLAQRKVEKQVPALFHIARAASYTGTGESLPAVRQQLDTYLTKVYTNYHGDTSGLAEIKELARKQPFPPADFKIKSSVEIATEKEEEFKKSNPMLAFWMSIRKELAGPDGEAYFNQHLKDAKIPPELPEVPKQLKGKLISMKPAANPKELVVGISDANTPEITLKFEAPLKGKADPGTELAFAGVASAFTKDPFNLVFDVEKEGLEGWPVQAAAPPAKKAPAPVKKAVPKKK